MAVEIEDPEYTDPPAPEPAPSNEPAAVTFSVDETERALPSFAQWVVDFGFDHTTLTPLQLDSLLGIYLKQSLNTPD